MKKQIKTNRWLAALLMLAIIILMGCAERDNPVEDHPMMNGLNYTVTPIDLSMVDCAGNERESRWTANCYMVHTAGNYKLPLVYGNAIKNGAVNMFAYNGIFGETFPNHNGDAIKAPWITRSTSDEGTNKGMGINVTSAELLWQDAKGLITAVDIDGDYLTLTVGKDATVQEGNAVVAAKNDMGTIVWSWHIWVTRQTFADLTTVNTGSYTYQLTPVNLGWVGDATSPTGYNTYYQWGRKDAFIPFTRTAQDLIVYDINNAEVKGLSCISGTTATIADNIKEPTTFFVTVKTNASCVNLFHTMWDALSINNNQKRTTVKTVYDPCPSGFCIPPGNLYYYINGVADDDFAWDADKNGRSLTNVSPNVFFPASCARPSFGSSITSINGLPGLFGRGNYWSSQFGEHYGYFHFDSSNYSWDGTYNYLADGYPIRAVAEE